VMVEVVVVTFVNYFVVFLTNNYFSYIHYKMMDYLKVQEVDIYSCSHILMDLRYNVKTFDNNDDVSLVEEQ
jgi:hypothetical protein